MAPIPARRPRPRATTNTIAGARPAPQPDFVEPCLATLRSHAPPGAEWVHEIKYDGYRLQIHIGDGRVRALTRRAYDWTPRFPTLVAAALELRAAGAILDGEVVVQTSRGVSDYALLQDDLAAGRTDRFVYVAFDLLYLDGFDLRPAKLIDRKAALKRLLPNGTGPLVYGEHLASEAEITQQRACDLGLEGLVSKRRDAPYRSGRQDSWIKVKCTKTDSFPIVAFVEKLGAQPRRIASLYIGRRSGDRLVYAGKARSGYTDATARRLREMLDPLIRRTSPLSHPIRKPKATWVEPTILADVQFSGVTEDGLLREAVFKGVREELAAESPPGSADGLRKGSPGRPVAQSTVRLLSAGAARADKPPHIGVPRENILQLLPDAVVPSKEALARYWQRVARAALVHLGRRPLKLVRHTHRTTFYHRGALPPVPPSVHQLRIQKREGGEGVRLWVDDLAGLLGLVEIGAVELHPWAATIDDIERADTLIFDLDPGPGVGWDFVVETALAMRDMLAREGLDSWPKLTGGKGLHLMAPLGRRMTHDTAHALARRLAQAFAARSPERYVTSATLARRAGRLFVDYLRNGRGTTAIGTFSPRVRAGFPVAARVTWREVERGIRPDAFTIERPPPMGGRRRRRNP
jgi:bifunctional non-homologous end joining protein LigD